VKQKTGIGKPEMDFELFPLDVTATVNLLPPITRANRYAARFG
jgi:hypothetical protein